MIARIIKYETRIQLQQVRWLARKVETGFFYIV